MTTPGTGGPAGPPPPSGGPTPPPSGSPPAPSSPGPGRLRAHLKVPATTGTATFRLELESFDAEMSPSGGGDGLGWLKSLPWWGKIIVLVLAVLLLLWLVGQMSSCSDSRSRSMVFRDTTTVGAAVPAPTVVPVPVAPLPAPVFQPACFVVTKIEAGETRVGDEVAPKRSSGTSFSDYPFIKWEYKWKNGCTPPPDTVMGLARIQKKVEGVWLDYDEKAAILSHLKLGWWIERFVVEDTAWHRVALFIDGQKFGPWFEYRDP